MKKIFLFLTLLMYAHVANTQSQQLELKCKPTMGRGKLPLHAAGIIEGPVSERGVLKPMRSRTNGAWVESYVFDGSYPEHLWCGYGPHHEILISQLLPADVKSCHVYYRPGSEEIDTKIDKIYCSRKE